MLAKIAHTFQQTTKQKQWGKTLQLDNYGCIFELVKHRKKKKANSDMVRKHKLLPKKKGKKCQEIMKQSQEKNKKDCNPVISYTVKSPFFGQKKNKVLSMQVLRNYINLVPFLNNINSKLPKVCILAEWKMIQIKMSCFIVKIYTHNVNSAVIKWHA